MYVDVETSRAERKRPLIQKKSSEVRIAVSIRIPMRIKSKYEAQF